jgi:hypothetical protein
VDIRGGSDASETAAGANGWDPPVSDSALAFRPLDLRKLRIPRSTTLTPYQISGPGRIVSLDALTHRLLLVVWDSGGDRSLRTYDNDSWGVYLESPHVRDQTVTYDVASACTEEVASTAARGVTNQTHPLTGHRPAAPLAVSATCLLSTPSYPRGPHGRPRWSDLNSGRLRGRSTLARTVSEITFLPWQPSRLVQNAWVGGEQGRGHGFEQRKKGKRVKFLGAAASPSSTTAPPLGNGIPHYPHLPVGENLGF